MTTALFQAGKLEQACGDCGRWEAAAFYCSGCARPMGPDDWYLNGDAARRAVAQNAAGNLPRTPVKRGLGRPSGTLTPDEAFAKGETDGHDRLL